MKNFSVYYKDLEDKYKNVFDSDRVINYKHISRVETFLYLLDRLGFIHKDISKAWTIFNGYHYNNRLTVKITEEEEILINKARGYLHGINGSTAFRTNIKDYMAYSERNKLLYIIEEQNKSLILQRNQCGVFKERVKLLEKLFNKTITIQNIEKKFYNKVDGFIMNEGVVEHIRFPKEIIHKPIPPKESVIKNRSTESITVKKEELLNVAKHIDTLINDCNYERRVSNILFDEILEDGLKEVDEITIDGLFNLVGRVGAGKSTLVEVLTTKLARESKKIAIVVDSIQAILECVQFYRALGIKAVPMWGYSGREGHITKAFSRIEEEDFLDVKNSEINMWFSETCPLDGLREGTDITNSFKIGKEPCQYIKSSAKDKEKFICPYYRICPCHRSEEELRDAEVFITTPAAFIKTKISEAVIDGDVRISEYLYYNCDLVIFDESDRVQLNFDGCFSDYMTLVDDSEESYLNKLGREVEAWFYKNRLKNTNNKKIKEWYDNFGNTQRVSNILIQMLGEHKKLVNKLNGKFYTAFTLYDIFKKGLNKEEVKKLNDKEMSDFLDKSLLKSPEGIKKIVSKLLANQYNDLELNNQINECFFYSSEVDNESTIMIKFIIVSAIFEKCFKETVNGLEELTELKNINLENVSMFYKAINDYMSFIPTSPMGNIFGFRVTADGNNNLKRLVVFKSNGIGRWLLTNYHNLYYSLEKIKGPNVLLLSGTSWAPKSYNYNIDTEINGVLKGSEEEARAIEESEFLLDPIYVNDEAITVSGSDLWERTEKLKSIVNGLVSTSVKNKKSKLERELDILDEDRKKILLLVGSYNEATELKKYLDRVLTNEGEIKRKDVSLLIKDGSDESIEEAIARGEVTDFGLDDSKVLIAPLMALERGYNILNINRKAAIGAVYFLVRPMPIPNDMSIIISKLNSSFISELNKKESTNIEEHVKWTKKTRDNYMKKMQELLIKSERLGYKQLEEKARDELCMTLFVTMCQVIGRLIRGGCKARVHFCDGKFAPNSLQNKEDNEKTSILVGIIRVLEKYIKSNSIVEKEIAKKLYYSFYKGLKECEGLRYGKRS